MRCRIAPLAKTLVLVPVLVSARARITVLWKPLAPKPVLVNVACLMTPVEILAAVNTDVLVPALVNVATQI